MQDMQLMPGKKYLLRATLFHARYSKIAVRSNYACRIAKTYNNFAILLPLLILVLLPGLSADGRASAARRGRILSSQEPGQSGVLKNSESQAIADAQVTTVLGKMAAAGIAQPATVADVRRAYRFYPQLSGTPEHVFRIEDRQIPGLSGNIPIRLYTPSSRSGMPVLVFFHGGGFVAGSLDTHDAPLRSLANRCECIIISVAYRLAPENKYPAAPDDAYAATKWVAEHGPDIGVDPHRIAVAGDGAGGNLAAVVTLMARERGGPPLLFQVLIYPTLEATTMRPSWWAESDVPTVSRESKNDILSVYLPVTGRLRDPFVSPLFAESLRTLPPALIVTYEDDAPMRVEAEEYADRLKEDNVMAKVSLYPKMIHGFFLMAGYLDGGKKCINEIASTLRDTFERTSK